MGEIATWSSQSRFLVHPGYVSAGHAACGACLKYSEIHAFVTQVNSISHVKHRASNVRLFVRSLFYFLFVVVHSEMQVHSESSASRSIMHTHGDYTYSLGGECMWLSFRGAFSGATRL